MKNINKILRILLWIVLIGGTIVLTGSINYSHKEEMCKEVVINIEDAQLYSFVDEAEIINILNNNFNTPISNKIGKINTHEIEKYLNELDFIENAEVYISIDGKLIISLLQRIPILRVFASKGSFYIDDKGKVMPVSKKFTAHVPVASGEIYLNYSELLELTNREISDSSDVPKLYSDLFKLSQFIHSNRFWAAQIEQLYVDKESEFELIPRVGNHTIVLGEVYDLETKFNKLMLFYEKGLSKTGWNEYKKINLKFKDQVVCTKRY